MKRDYALVNLTYSCTSPVGFWARRGILNDPFGVTKSTEIIRENIETFSRYSLATYIGSVWAPDERWNPTIRIVFYRRIEMKKIDWNSAGQRPYRHAERIRRKMRIWRIHSWQFPRRAGRVSTFNPHPRTFSRRYFVFLTVFVGFFFIFYLFERVYYYISYVSFGKNVTIDFRF